MGIVWVTGLPGTGKSAVAHGLSSRGEQAWDVDDGMATWRHRSSGVAIGVGPAVRPEGWVDRYAWVVERSTLVGVAAAATTGTAYLCGAVENEDEVVSWCSRVVCLVVDRATLHRRIIGRQPPAFGSSPGEIEQILQWADTATGRYIAMGAVLVDASAPLEHVVAEVIDAAAR